MRSSLKQGLRTRQKFVRRAAVALSLLLIGGLVAYFQFSDVKDVRAAATGDFQTRGSGAWNGTTTWQRYNGSSWVNSLTGPSSSDGVITILSGHTVTVSLPVTADQLVVNSGGQLDVNTGMTLSIANGTGTDLTVNGTLRNAGTINMGGSVTASFGSTGTYIHNQNGGTIPTATWNAASNCRLTGITNSYPSGAGQTFGHFTFNSPLVTDVEMSSNLTTAGNLNISGTGTRTLFLTNSSNNRTITVGANFNDSAGTFTAVNNSGTSTISVAGNFNLAGGTFNMKNGNGTSAMSVTGDMNFTSGTMRLRSTSTVNNATLTLARHFTMSGGTLDFTSVAANSTMNVAGNFSHTGGTMTESSTGVGSIVFNRSGTQVVTSGGTVSNAINYTVNSGSTLQLGTQLLGSGSTGTFTLSSGGGLILGDPSGITSAENAGNIRVSGTRTYSTGGSYTYNGASAQQTGSGLPATVANLTINNSSGVTLTNTTAVSSVLTLTNGKVTTGSFELNVTNTSTSAVTGHSQSSYVVGNLRRSINGSGTYAFPIGTAAEYELASTTLSGITGTTNLLATFTNSNPLTVANPLQSLWLNGVDIVDMLDYGYWTLTPNTAATGGTFSLSLSQRGHTNVAGRTGFTPLSRTSVGNDWQTLGNSVSGSLVSGTVTTVRSGLSDFMDFGIGIAEQPKSMVFLNSSLISGTAGQVGAIYKFPNVTTGIDAWVTLMDKEGGATLSDVDNFTAGNGYDIAWQPFVNHPANDTSSIGWKIQFKKNGTSTDTTITNVAITGIDIDGAGSIREFVEATRPYSYSLAVVTTLTITELDTSYRATGDYPTINNIDTSHTEAMYQINYSNINTFYYRTGAISTSSSMEMRQHALMFNATLTNNASSNTSLPVSLLYFKPTAKKDRVQLDWATATEVNNDYFVIERSADGRNFEEILRKSGYGNSSTTIAYTDIDYSPLSGISYYRLKQVDYDGKFEYFPMKAVRFGKTDNSRALSIESTGPNPFTSAFNIHYRSEEAGDVEITITSATGQLVHHSTVHAELGSNDFAFTQAAELSAGLYVVTLRKGDEGVSVKLKKE